MWTLTLPIVVGLVGFILPSMEAVTFVMSFAVIPYVVCAIVLAVLIRRSRTLKQLLWLSISAPILMGAFMVVFLVIIDPPELRSISRLSQLTSTFPLSAIVAYCYVALAWVGFAVGAKYGLVSGAAPPNKALKGDAPKRRAP